MADNPGSVTTRNCSSSSKKRRYLQTLRARSSHVHLHWRLTISRKCIVISWRPTQYVIDGRGSVATRLNCGYASRCHGSHAPRDVMSCNRVFLGRLGRGVLGAVRGASTVARSSRRLVLYSKPGCHLCEGLKVVSSSAAQVVVASACRAYRGENIVPPPLLSRVVKHVVKAAVSLASTVHNPRPHQTRC